VRVTQNGRGNSAFCVPGVSPEEDGSRLRFVNLNQNALISLVKIKVPRG
jgi:hypothetical protein